jgi:protein translocase SecG subunit
VQAFFIPQLQQLPRSGIVFSDMELIESVLPYAQITLSILLTATILLQQRGSNLGGAFGGDNFSAAFHKRRGAELFLFRSTIVLGILFVASALLALAV